MSQSSLFPTLDAPPAAPAPEKPAGDGIVRSAEMSLDRRYRYRLDRVWGPGSLCLWGCLNPSDADGLRDDPSCHRMMRFGRAWGHCGIVIVNLGALVSSHPDALYDASDPIGPNNDKIIREAAEEVAAGGGRLVAAYGCSMRFDDLAPPAFRERDRAMLRILTSVGDVYCLGRTSSGDPIHPLARGRSRVPDSAEPVLFAAKGSIP